MNLKQVVEFITCWLNVPRRSHQWPWKLLLPHQWPLAQCLRFLRGTPRPNSEMRWWRHRCSRFGCWWLGIPVDRVDSCRSTRAILCVLVCIRSWGNCQENSKHWKRCGRDPLPIFNEEFWWILQLQVTCNVWSCFYRGATIYATSSVIQSYVAATSGSMNLTYSLQDIHSINILKLC